MLLRGQNLLGYRHYADDVVDYFVQKSIADGIDIKMVAELMGHKNIEVTHKYYTQYAIEKRKEVMQNFDITVNR